MNIFSGANGAPKSDQPRHVKADAALLKYSRLDGDALLAQLNASADGLSGEEAASRLKQFGPNRVTRERKLTIVEEIWQRARNPLNALLATLAVTSYVLGDVRAAIVIGAMVVLAIVTAFVQEHRSNEAAAQLRAMVHTTASVRRRPQPSPDEPFAEVPMEQLVPGDIVHLSAGDMIPADVRLLERQGPVHQPGGADRRSHAGREIRRSCATSPRRRRSTRSICPISASWARMWCSGTPPASSCAPAPRTFFGALAEQIAGGARRPPSIAASTASPG